MFVDFRDNNQVFDGVMARFGRALHTGVAGKTERVAGEIVSGTHFQTLGVNAAAGRVHTGR